jgi:hypothetical protein
MHKCIYYFHRNIKAQWLLKVSVEKAITYCVKSRVTANGLFYTNLQVNPTHKITDASYIDDY